MPDGAVIIAAITSCTNTSNPRNVIAAALLARNANRAGLTRKPWVKSSLAPGSKAVQTLSRRGRAAVRVGDAGLRHCRLCLHHLQRDERRARPKISRKSSIATSMRPPSYRVTATSTAASIPMPSRPSWPRRPWSSPMPSPAPSASTSKKTCSVMMPTAGRCVWPISGRTMPRSTPSSHNRSSPSSSDKCMNRCLPANRPPRPRSVHSMIGAHNRPISAARPIGRAPWPASAH